MTDRILHRLGGQEFLEQCYGRAHRLVTGDPAAWDGLLSWSALNDILTFHSLRSPRLRLSKAGTRVPVEDYTQPHDPRFSRGSRRLQPSALHRALADGASLILDDIDQLHPPISELAAGLERVFGNSAKINAYATWTTTAAFGPHWDPHDVIVLQLDGAKRWRIYGPTREAPMFVDIERPDKPPPHAPPLADIVLTAGDLLYLPRGWWHAVAAPEGTRSLHLTCDLNPITGAHLLHWLSETLRGSATIRAELPRFATPEQQAVHLEQLAKEVIAELQDPTLLQRFFAALDGNDPGHPHPSLPYVEAMPADPHLTVRLLTPRAHLRTTTDGHTVLTAGGGTWTFTGTVGPLLSLLIDGNSHTLAELAGATTLTVKQAAHIVTELISRDVATIA